VAKAYKVVLNMEKDKTEMDACQGQKKVLEVPIRLQ
jgi:hypothetical protein